MVFPRLAAVGGAVPDVRRHIFGEIDSSWTDTPTALSWFKF
ncbi:hypothetical protein [Neisseria meningitidis]|nr:hypothetical protein [Neisseria meningitidis]